MKLKIIGILLAVLVLQACTTHKNAHLGTKTIWMGGYKTECSIGASKGDCFMVAYQTDLVNAKWEKIYIPIEGFNFELGFLQKIEVKAVELPKNGLVEDRSSIKYKLIKVLEKQQDLRLELQGNWILNSINGVVVTRNEEQPHIKIDLMKNQFSGNNGCTSFSGVIMNVTTSQLYFEKTKTTLRDCADVPLASDFDSALRNIDTYNIQNDNLSIFNKANELVLAFTKKAPSTADTRINDIWVAIEINGEAVGQSEELPRMELNLNTMQLFGNDGCNQFNGKITTVTEKNIAFGPVTATKKRCQDKEVPTKFNQALQKATSYSFANSYLSIYDKSGTELIKFQKVD